MNLSSIQIKNSLRILVAIIILGTFSVLAMTVITNLQNTKSIEALSQVMTQYAPADVIEQNSVLQTRAEKNTGYMIVISIIIGLCTLGFAFFVHRMLTAVIVKPFAQVEEYFGRMAKGELNQNIQINGNNEVARILHGLVNMQEKLGSIVDQVRDSLSVINDHGDRLGSDNLDLSSRTEEQSAALQQTAASMEQLSSTVKQNADNARQANKLALDASVVAEKGGEVMQDVVTTMHDISDGSRKIADIVNMIDSIAFQTNILAINAAVEAARAGEQGNGFAVVASEVRALSQRSAEAAKEIKLLIDASVSQVGSGVNLVEQAGETMKNIVTSISQVTTIMGEISSATEEQATGIDQINRAVIQMDNVTQQNAELVERLSSSTELLNQRIDEAMNSMAIIVTNGHRSFVDEAIYQSKINSVSKPKAKALAKSAPAALPNSLQQAWDQRMAFGEKDVALITDAAEDLRSPFKPGKVKEEEWTSF
ncbi:MAG: HAMP domain-containing protein [Alcaligenaceae bacterium]|nr:HAMP domain-containing protein [Alcaligenaceae bacterium]